MAEIKWAVLGTGVITKWWQLRWQSGTNIYAVGNPRTQLARLLRHDFAESI